jgi:hypothetical protein
MAIGCLTRADEAKTRTGAILFGLGLSLPWLLAAPALMLRFGL